jgi:hypothetical protein
MVSWVARQRDRDRSKSDTLPLFGVCRSNVTCGARALILCNARVAGAMARRIATQKTDQHHGSPVKVGTLDHLRGWFDLQIAIADGGYLPAGDFDVE